MGDPREVARVARVPLAELADPANRFRVRHSSGYVGPAFAVADMLVWGFTAGLLEAILEAAGLAEPWDESDVRPLPASALRPYALPGAVDAVAGAVVSAIAVLLVAWMVASPLATSPFPTVAGQVRQSALVQAVDHAVPDGVRTVYDSLRTAIDRRGLPDVLDPLTPTEAREVPPPDEALLNSPVVESVKGSVVKISGIAPSCSRQIDGSGFVYAPERVMTNAHVLAGVADPVVLAEGDEYDATPVYVDEATDIAVLAVPDLPQVPLSFTPTPADTGDDSIIMGYPGGGDFYVGAARVRDRGEISGPDFRDTRTVVRDVYALFGDVRAGNSGGPLFAPDGSVLGVVFASAIDDPSTGYALTAEQVAAAARTGSTAQAEVGTGPCE